MIFNANSNMILWWVRSKYLVSTVHSVDEFDKNHMGASTILKQGTWKPTAIYGYSGYYYVHVYVYNVYIILCSIIMTFVIFVATI